MEDSVDFVAAGLGFRSPNFARGGVELDGPVDSNELELIGRPLQEAWCWLPLHGRRLGLGDDDRSGADVDLLERLRVQVWNEAPGEYDPVLAGEVILDSAAESIVDFSAGIDFAEVEHSGIRIQDCCPSLKTGLAAGRRQGLGSS